MTDPRPVSDIDKAAEDTLRLSRRLIYGVMVGQGILLLLVAIVAGTLAVRAFGERGRTDAQVRKVVSSQCGFDYPVAIAPVDPKTTSKLGVQLIEGARVAVIGLACPEKIGPPPASLVQLGQKYSIPIR